MDEQTTEITALDLSDDQQNAVTKFLEFLRGDKKEFVISGGPGMGKSYLVKHLVSTLRDHPDVMKLLMGDSWEYEIFFTASTNKAAEVLESLVNEPATTIHSLLGLRVVNNYSTGKTQLKKGKDSKTFQNCLILVDEASMVDAELLKVIRESTINCKICFVGDSNQLAPVFASTCPVFDIENQVALTTPHRQEEGSAIITLSRQFESAVTTDIFPALASMGKEIQVTTGAEFQEAMDREFSAENNVKAIAWTNRRVHQYNAYIRDLLGHPEEYEAGERLIANSPVILHSRIFYKTDQTATIKDVEPAEEHGIQGQWITLGKGCTVFLANERFRVDSLLKQLAKDKSWHNYFKLKDFFVDLRPSYASTVFKVQGATHDTVFVDVADFAGCKHNNQIARMMNVAISRATTKVYLQGELPKRVYESK